MYGDLAQKLVQHAKRTQSLAHLPSYQTELVRAVTRETRDLDRDVKEIVSTLPGDFQPNEEPPTAYNLLIHGICMRRNKRCLLVYHKTRLSKIEEMCWNGTIEERTDVAEEEGAMEGVEGGEAQEEEGDKFSPEEEEYARQYSELLATTKGVWTDIDLTGSLEPPRDLFVDVRVLKDAGEIQTEYGAINLTKNSQFFVRQGDVERLIAQGFLQRLS